MDLLHKEDPIDVGVDRMGTGEPPFHRVSLGKFSLLSVSTLGLYELYWFYRNWKLLKAESGRDISPFWRAVFSPIFCYSLGQSIDDAAEKANVPERTHPAVLAGLYFALVLAHRLPDPYWLVSLLSFVPLVPFVRQIERIHETLRPGVDSRVGWGVGSVAALVLGSLITALAVAASFAPPTRALEGAEIPESYQATLLEAGILQPDERMVFFYSMGLFSILEDGNLLTDRRVVSYETLEGELLVASAPYEEVEEVDARFSESVFEDTLISVSTLHGEQFVLIVSAEDGGDRRFVAELRRRTGRTAPP